MGLTSESSARAQPPGQCGAAVRAVLPCPAASGVTLSAFSLAFQTPLNLRDSACKVVSSSLIHSFNFFVFTEHLPITCKLTEIHLYSCFFPTFSNLMGFTPNSSLCVFWMHNIQKGPHLRKTCTLLGFHAMTANTKKCDAYGKKTQRREAQAGWAGI